MASPPRSRSASGGIDAHLFEQADAFREVGAGIQLSANATRVLRTLGLGEALARVAVYPERREYRAWDTGERLFWTPLGERAEKYFGAPYYQAHRAAEGFDTADLRDAKGAAR